MSVAQQGHKPNLQVGIQMIEPGDHLLAWFLDFINIFFSFWVIVVDIYSST